MIGILLLALMIQCKPTQGVSDPQEVSEDRVFLEMSKTRCFGTCPAYTVKLYLSGKVEFNGEYNTPVEGSREFQMEKTDLDKIQQELTDLNFFDLEDRYYKDVTDLPTTYLTVNQGNRVKKVMDYYGAPAKLKRFEELVEEIIFNNLNDD